MKKQAIAQNEYRGNTWVDVAKEKPVLGQNVMVFIQGYGKFNNYYANYALAAYIKNPHDKRKTCFANMLQVKFAHDIPLIYKNVTHWMPLPAAPRKIILSEYTFVHNKTK